MEDRNVFTAGVLHCVLPIPMQRIAHVLFRSITMLKPGGRCRLAPV